MGGNELCSKSPLPPPAPPLTSVSAILLLLLLLGDPRLPHRQRRPRPILTSRGLWGCGGLPGAVGGLWWPRVQGLLGGLGGLLSGGLLPGGFLLGGFLLGRFLLGGFLLGLFGALGGLFRAFGGLLLGLLGGLLPVGVLVPVPVLLGTTGSLFGFLGGFGCFVLLGFLGFLGLRQQLPGLCGSRAGCRQPPAKCPQPCPVLPVLSISVHPNSFHAPLPTQLPLCHYPHPSALISVPLNPLPSISVPSFHCPHPSSLNAPQFLYSSFPHASAPTSILLQPIVTIPVPPMPVPPQRPTLHHPHPITPI